VGAANNGGASAGLFQRKTADAAVAARGVFAAWGKRLCCHPTLTIRSPLDILMVTTMALV